MVFAANGALIDAVTNTAIVSHFQANTRVDESNHWQKFLREHRYKVVTTHAKCEGQGDSLLSHNGKMLWYGYGFRSEIEGASEIKTHCPHLDIQQLKLCDEHFYHLDTCFCVLDDNTVMYYPEAFDTDGIQKIENAFTNVIQVSAYDAHNFACNAVIIDKTVVLHSAGRDLKMHLRKHGFTVIENNMSEFLLSGGSAKCCVMHR